MMDHKYLLKKIGSTKRKDGRKRKPGFSKLNHNITYDYMWSIYPDSEICPVFGFRMDCESENYDLRPSIDRIDSNLGYEKGNVIWISYLANRMKSDLTLEELVRIGKWAKKELAK